MTAKRLLALLVAVLMLVMLFSACANGGNDDANQPDNGSGNAGDTGDTGDTGDNPDEKEPLKLTYMGCETHQWSFTLDEAKAKGFESLDNYHQKMLEAQNLVVEVEVFDKESYKTTLSGYLAANALLDAFLIEGRLHGRRCHG